MINPDILYKIQDEIRPIFYELSQYILSGENISFNYCGGKVKFIFNDNN